MANEIESIVRDLVAAIHAERGAGGELKMGDYLKRRKQLERARDAVVSVFGSLLDSLEDEYFPAVGAENMPAPVAGRALPADAGTMAAATAVRPY